MELPENFDEMCKTMKNALWGSLCSQCEHKEVCKYYDESKDKCENFKERMNYKLHRSIEEMFVPIFKWMQFHYPAGNVTFYVEPRRAQMHLDYNVAVYDKSLLNYQPIQIREKPDREKKQE